METSTMAELFDTHGLGVETRKLRNFRPLLQHVRKWHESVWDLKRFVMSTAAEPERAVANDYGFVNCLDSAQERMSLNRLYRRYFDEGLDEMGLHRACVDGNLAPFLTSVLREPAFPPELLTNNYPLPRCSHMGLVAERVVMCTESNYAMVCEMRRADGDDSVVLTIPDEYDEGMQKLMRERAAALDESMEIKGVVLMRAD